MNRLQAEIIENNKNKFSNVFCHKSIGYYLITILMKLKNNTLQRNVLISKKTVKNNLSKKNNKNIIERQGGCCKEKCV